MKDLFDAINTRIKEPYWGFFILSFLVFNWRGLFLLCFAVGTAQEKIIIFESETSISTLIIYPTLTTLIILLITPWLRVIFGWMSRLAYEKLNSQEVIREHKYLAHKNLLEQERTRALENKENELIAQAQRDVDIENIENEKVKESLKHEIEQLRKERSEIANNVHIKNIIRNNTHELNEFEYKILNFLSLAKDNFIKKGRDVQYGYFFQLNNQSILKSKDMRSYLKFEDGIKSLIKRNLIQDLGSEGKIFELTDLGRDYITKLDMQ